MKNDTPNQRVRKDQFTLVEAAIGWAGLSGNLPHMSSKMHLGGMPDSKGFWPPNPPVVKQDGLPEDPCLPDKCSELREKYGWLIEATDSAELPYYGLMDPFLPEEDRNMAVAPQLRVVSRNDLKKWIQENHPDKLPSFLFSKAELGEAEKELNSSHKKSVYLMIYALASMGKTDLTTPNAVSTIKKRIELIGHSLSDDTIRKIRDEVTEMFNLKKS